MPYKDKAKEKEVRKLNYQKNIEHIREMNTERMRRYRASNPKYLERARDRLRFIRENVEGYREKELEKNRIRNKEALQNPEFRKQKYEINHQRYLARKKYCLENGICHNKNMTCTEKALSTHKMCEMHVFEEFAHRHLKNDSRWKELRDLFYSQNQECYLTKKKLVLGVNASLDHIIPTSKGGTNETTNLAWMDENTNYAKNNLTNEQFIELCYSISENNPRKGKPLP